MAGSANNFTIYIRDEDLQIWLKIKNRPKFLSDMIKKHGEKYKEKSVN